MKTTVGVLREQAALSPPDRRVVIVSDDPELSAMGLHVVEFYPDTTDEHGRWNCDSTFKIKVSREVQP